MPGNRTKPLSPMFDPETKYGSIAVGNTPPTGQPVLVAAGEMPFSDDVLNGDFLIGVWTYGALGAIGYSTVGSTASFTLSEDDAADYDTGAGNKATSRLVVFSITADGVFDLSFTGSPTEGVWYHARNVTTIAQAKLAVALNDTGSAVSKAFDSAPSGFVVAGLVNAGSTGSNEGFTLTSDHNLRHEAQTISGRTYEARIFDSNSQPQTFSGSFDESWQTEFGGHAVGLVELT